MRLFLTVIITFLLNSLIAQPAGYAYGKQILINASQVAGSTDFNDFQILVNMTDNNLRSTANGGHVNNGNGFDILFTTGDCNTVLDHQIEKYVASTGEYIAWVKIPTLNATSNTNIHMYYGNASVSADPSTTNTWTANHGAVYHMNQSPVATTTLTDYSSNTNNGIANGSMTASDLVTGKIGYGIDFDGSNDYIDCGANASTFPSGDITVSAWIYSRAASGHIINRGGGWNDPGYSLFHLGNGVRIELQRSGEKDIVDNPLSINTWHYVALTYNNTSKLIKFFLDGVQQPNTGNHTGPIGMPVENLNIGRKQKNAYYFNGIIDEGRVIMEDRSDDWMLTEYRNQNTPNTFYTKSAEYSAGSLCNTLPIVLLDFSAELAIENKVDIRWETASETNNDYFLIEKSLDGKNWNTVTRIKGAGNSTARIHYKTVDSLVVNTVIVYYRLTQVDYDGQFTHSKIISIISNYNTPYSSNVYPNPFENVLTVNTAPSSILKVYNMSGVLIFQTTLLLATNQVDLSFLPTGLYMIFVGNKQYKLIKQ
ncbi:hypothetical protein DNU06_08570 [Putridiphycobacter roseus]|uniref:LamG-like jellyroll fold domain-containing protein n=1 Tax=Putridiphycobacter roseus TaxID=2219161 RepID=A0A2W1N0M7_9FLAO|nr:DUF2341 domain-containing protein [Putridiphycobacter roseus]PZE17314.1 hypothetical protein DNU06_08570 [Putridiphycobacter roseus]